MPEEESFLRPLIYFRRAKLFGRPCVALCSVPIVLSKLATHFPLKWFIIFSNRMYDGWFFPYNFHIIFFSISLCASTLRAGDRILSVNGLDCDELDYDQVIDQMRRIPRDVELLVLHRSDAANVSSTWRLLPSSSSSWENRIRPDLETSSTIHSVCASCFVY